jgi:hypothetical protein
MPLWQVRLFEDWGLVSGVMLVPGKGLTWYTTDLLHRVAAMLAEATTDNAEGEAS